MTIRALLRAAQDKLAPDPLARLEAEILLGHALDVSRSFLFANPELAVPMKRRTDFLSLIRRRCQGEPIAYLTGKRAFWTLELKVSPDVLIPRPETELLVELALERIPPDHAWRIADLGTGSGAIALAIASERPTCEILASDLSEKALQIARENAQALAPGSISFYQGSWLEPLPGNFQLIVSNPPYVDMDDPHLTRGDCRFEPVLALSPGSDGLEAIRHICAEAVSRLDPGGWLLLEHGNEQASDVRAQLVLAGFESVSTRADLAGLDRVSMGQARKRLD
ncbi:MAG TPA: peptide chain release factor N(5)-glutamine methyltransferase [Xanthomonadales bacterium]|nr:peptide chain release factor N(5)-glutamine methyltransferase [Xanthomonadales bacterium]